MNEIASPGNPRFDERERRLIHIGREAIAVEDEQKLNAYFADGYRFSGPDGDANFGK